MPLIDALISARRELAATQICSYITKNIKLMWNISSVVNDYTLVQNQNLIIRTHGIHPGIELGNVTGVRTRGYRHGLQW